MMQVAYVIVQVVIAAAWFQAGRNYERKHPAHERELWRQRRNR